MIQYAGLSEINGPLVCLQGVKGVAYDEIGEITLSDGSKRLGRVVEMQGDKVVLQVFEGTNGISLSNTKIAFSGKPLEIPLSTEMLGRTFSGAGKPIDGLGDVVAQNICAEAKIKPFISVEEFQKRCKVSQTLVDKMKAMGVLNNMPETSQLSLF